MNLNELLSCLWFHWNCSRHQWSPKNRCTRLYMFSVSIIKNVFLNNYHHQRRLYQWRIHRKRGPTCKYCWVLLNSEVKLKAIFRLLLSVNDCFHFYSDLDFVPVLLSQRVCIRPGIILRATAGCTKQLLVLNRDNKKILNSNSQMLFSHMLFRYNNLVCIRQSYICCHHYVGH